MSTDLPFLDSYGGQSTNELIDLEGAYRIDSIVLAFEEALQRKANLTREEKVILAVEALEREVNNGGYSQFFCNSSRDFVPDIGGALNVIGCPKTASLTQSAMTVLGVDISMTSDEIEDAACDASETQDEDLGELDAIYYRGDEEPIADKLFEFIKINRSSITVGVFK
jgi:hypothetical protein